MWCRAHRSILTPEEVNAAEVAVAQLKGCRRGDGHPASLLDAATFYAEHLKGIERVPLAKAPYDSEGNLAHPLCRPRGWNLSRQLISLDSMAK